MKTKLLLLLIFLTPVLFAQQSDNDDTPKNIIKSFNKRFPRATDISWDQVDNNYKVDFIFRDRLSYAEYTPEGEWLMTVVDKDINNIYPPIDRYLKEHYKKDKILFIEKATKKDRKDYYYIQVSRKIKGVKEPFIIELYFNKTGKIEEVIKPDELKDVENEGNEDIIDVPEIVLKNFNKRFPRVTELIWDIIDTNYTVDFEYRDKTTNAEFSPGGVWVLTKTEIDPKNLFSPIKRYIDQNYKSQKVQYAEKVVKSDRNNYYYVQIYKKIKGVKYITVLYFNKVGKFTKVIRPKGLEDEYSNQVEAPEIVLKKFKSRFVRATDITWETLDSNYIAKFIFREKKTVAQFTTEGQWLMTTFEIDTKNIYAPIQRFLEKNCSDYKVNFIEKTTKNDRKDFYYVELYGKKKNIDPQELGLYFNKSGKLIED